MRHEEVRSLHRVDTLPIDSNSDVFRQFPAMKLGVLRSVRHYAELLAPLAKRWIFEDADHRDWVLTAPAVVADTPAAANLLCRELFEKLEGDLGPSRSLVMLALEHQRQSSAAWDWKAPDKSQDYAQLTFDDRVRERQQMSNSLIFDERLKGGAILFVNDILVTGAQQQAMRQYFDRVQAACVKWLYVIEVDQAIGRAEPQLEWRMNLVSFEELLSMVAGESIEYTGKCVQKLMQLSLPELEQVLRALDQDRRARLLALAVANGFHLRQGFQKQMDLLQAHAERL